MLHFSARPTQYLPPFVPLISRRASSEIRNRGVVYCVKAQILSTDNTEAVEKHREAIASQGELLMRTSTSIYEKKEVHN